MDFTNPRHHRSKSDLDRKRFSEDKLNTTWKASPHFNSEKEHVSSSIEANRMRFRSTEVQNSLKEEILQLQKQLKDQIFLRSKLEKASSSRPLAHDSTTETSFAQPAMDLIKEISRLELEVIFLEKYLLSLYRKTFHQKELSISAAKGQANINSSTIDSISSELPTTCSKSTNKSVALYNGSLPVLVSIDSPSKECSGIQGQEPIVDSCIHRSHSSLSRHSACSFRGSPPTRSVGEAVHSYHSLPLLMMQHEKDVSLAEQLGGVISDHVHETPNWISEEMIRCISAIYCRLADPPLSNHAHTFSPVSFSSSASESSPRGQCGASSPRCEGQSSFNSSLNNPFHFEGFKEFSESYLKRFEVNTICRDGERLSGVEHMLQNYRSLVTRLEEIDPRKLKHEEKLAFWINVHNALVMHAFLVYGIPRGTLKRISLSLKAAYDIGGQIVSADNIQHTILGCRLPRPGQWFRSLLFPKAKLKTGDMRKAYAIEHQQPLLQFALCLGSQSDPMVRVYTPKGVFQELEVAKEEYVHSNVRIRKEQRILLPKIMDFYAKDSNLCTADLLDTIDHSVPDHLLDIFRRSKRGKLSKAVEWVPHDFTFRYVLSPDLAT